MSYLDTSVLVAYYCPAPLSRAAEREVRHAAAPAISLLTEVEFSSVLSLKTRQGELSVASARSILACFQLHRAEGKYRILPLEDREATVACEWLASFTTPLRTMDALHLAAAFTNALTLVTADHALARSARLLGVKYQLIS